MKSLFLLPILLTGLLIAGCSSTPTHLDKGAIKAHTFNFINGGIALTPPATEKRDAVHQQIQAAIIKNLAAKGLTRTDGAGDVIVAYMVILGNNVSTEAVTTYFGSGRDADALHDKAQAAYTTNANPNHFEAGTLLIDVIDAKTYELLYREFAVRPIQGDATTEERAGHIQAAVDAALAKVRVAN
jgi:Domain of unknown function (DUF4136)